MRIVGGMRILLFNLLLFLIAGYALVRGGAPERIVALLFVAAAGATRAIAVSLVHPFENVEIGIMLVDTILLAALVAVALRANRFWPMNVASLQLFAVSLHFVKFLKPDIFPWIYAVTLGALGYPMIALLAQGTYRHRRRIRDGAPDPPWSTSFVRSPVAVRRRWREPF